MDIKEALRLLIQRINTQQDSGGKICTVLEVNGNTAVCRPVNGDADILDVRLTAHEADAIWTLTPKEGSVVIVEWLSPDAAYISQVSEVSDVSCKIGEVEYHLNADGMLLKKGDDNLLEALELIIESVEVILVLQGNNPDYQKLQAAKTKLKNILK
jgi:hypothetical protein